MEALWPVRLFQKSVLKQTKFREITTLLGPTDNLHCLDIGSDNGVISYLFRQQGGTWKSADLDERSVRAMQELVKTEVYRIDGRGTPFQDNEFDRVVVVDFLEHIHEDREFVDEVYRILKPGGIVIFNAPNLKNDLLTRFRTAIGLTDEDHGHVRPGYTLESIRSLLGDKFTIQASSTYTRFFSKLTDTLMVFALTQLKKNSNEARSGRGVLVTGQEMRQYKSAFRMYSLIYPIVWLFSRLDSLLFFTSGYMLIAKAISTKQPIPVEARKADHCATQTTLVANPQGTR